MNTILLRIVPFGFGHVLPFALVLLFGTLFLTGCSVLKMGSARSGGEVKLSAVLAVPPKIVVRDIPRSELEQAIKQGVGERGVRIVKIFRRSTSATIPEHRVFDVKEGGPFHILGVRSGDVLLGVNDRLIPNPNVMSGYPQAVLQDGKSSLTVSRSDEVIQFDITIS